MNSPEWTVGQVAERFDLPTNVLRHWETVGLLTPERDSADRRRYRRDDVVKVAVIQRSKAAGMSLDQIRTLMDSEARGRHELLEAHIADLDRRMDEVRRSKEMAEHAFSCREHDVTACPGFRKHVEDLLTDF
ncbi:MAG: MerR family transcriptional regulator [Propionibacteriales bacterium]|nr:MerR family transcriptional regulator [Propionibacteriales bacterium]